MPLGDGNASFFEGRFFDIFRGPDGKAAAAADRAAEAAAKAVYRAELADGDSEVGEAAPDTPGVHTVRDTRGAVMPLKDRAARKMLMRHRKVLKAIAQAQEEHAKRMDDFEAAAKRLVRELARREQGVAGMLDKASTVTAGMVGVLNASDRVAIPVAMQASVALRTVQDLGWANANKAVRVLADILHIVAYYDSTVGIASLWTVQSPGTGTTGLTDAERETLSRLTDLAETYGLV